MPCHYEILYADGLSNLRCSINKFDCVHISMFNIHLNVHILYHVIWVDFTHIHTYKVLNTNTYTHRVTILIVTSHCSHVCLNPNIKLGARNFHHKFHHFCRSYPLFAQIKKPRNNRKFFLLMDNLMKYKIKFGGT